MSAEQLGIICFSSCLPATGPTKPATKTVPEFATIYLHGKSRPVFKIIRAEARKYQALQHFREWAAKLEEEN